MPKIVDHEQRRRELAEALWRVIAESGPEAVSIRSVAAEAGWSPGALRHYFATREDLLVFAVNLSEERVTRRIAELRRTQSPHTPLLEQVAAYAEQLLPLDPVRRAEYRAWESAALLGEYDRERGRHWNAQRGLYRQLVAALAGVPAPDPSGPHPEAAVEEWSGHLHTYVDGLALQLVLSPATTGPDRARQSLRVFLARVREALRDHDAFS
ncbi:MULTISPECIES: TetR/AcrR family transcriptional regulator [unclassified Nocardiopsis]|uniref:TetR/AcrR family transcriptional regulator n=1 Tax=unclassified Nocardiopsis TaxID=2649073 RepID=UPI001358048F|nr:MULTISPECIES: TetR/AcrR family transcriptional regulator [unclassified Nocardiopsis]